MKIEKYSYFESRIVDNDKHILSYAGCACEAIDNALNNNTKLNELVGKFIIDIEITGYFADNIPLSLSEHTYKITEITYDLIKELLVIE